MTKYGALIAFGLMTDRYEDTTTKNRRRQNTRYEEAARAVPETGTTHRGPSQAKQTSQRGGIGRVASAKGKDDMNAKEPYWIRLAAAAALLGGTLLAGRVAVSQLLAESQGLLDVLGALAAALLAVGVVGLYQHARRSKSFGWLGRTGADLAVASFALVAVGGMVAGADGARPVWMFVAVGSILFGAAVLRTRVLPLGGAAVTLAAASVYLVTAVAIILGAEAGWLLPMAEALAGLGWAWMGAGLLSHREKVADYLGSPASS